MINPKELEIQIIEQLKTELGREPTRTEVLDVFDDLCGALIDRDYDRVKERSTLEQLFQ